MSERKVLNKYYPPDFDATKIPKSRLPKNRNFGIRLMAPFNMRCNTCGEYIYKGKKFNSQKETVDDMKYLGLHIFRFYIKCPRCIAVIAFRTDPQSTDYVLEAGATRNFEALRTAEQMAIKEQKEKEEELKNNPMKVLENRSLKSQQEIEMIETLEELRQIRKTQNRFDTEEFIEKQNKSAKEIAEQLAKEQEEADDEYVRSIFRVKRIRREEDQPVTQINSEPMKAPEKVDSWKTSSIRSQSEILKKLPLKVNRKRKADDSTAGSSFAAPCSQDVTAASGAKAMRLDSAASAADTVPSLVPGLAPATTAAPRGAVPTSKGAAASLLVGYSDSDSSNEEDN